MDFKKLTYTEYLDIINQFLDDSTNLISWGEQISDMLPEIADLLKQVEKLQKVDVSDIYTVDGLPNPDEYDWFEDVADEVAGETYDKFESVLRRVDNVTKQLDILDDIQYDLSHIQELLENLEDLED